MELAPINVNFEYKAPSSTAGVVPVSDVSLASNFNTFANKTSFNTGELSSDLGVVKAGTPQTSADAQMIGGQLAAFKEQQAAAAKAAGTAQLALAGASFFIDVMNANSSYNAVAGQAALNIIQTKNQAADAIFRGHQAQMGAQSEGRQAGQQALLLMAAQGQDLKSAGVEKIQGSLEAMGIMNGMQEEINSMREAMGFQLEEANYKYQVAQAGIAKNNAILGSALNFGAQIGSAAYTGVI